MSISKKDAAELVAKIKHANIAAHAIATRMQVADFMRDDVVRGAFLGALESNLQFFLINQGCAEAAKQLAAAMNYAPTEHDIAVHEMELRRLMGRAAA